MVEALLKGLALGLLLAISVGPVIFTVIKQSINNGREGGLSFVAGVWASDILLVVLSNAFTELVRTLLVYKQTIGLVGSVFLISMGVYYVFFKKIHLRTDAEGNLVKFSKRDFVKISIAGFLLNTLNPGVIFFWLINATAFSITHSFQQRIIIFSACMSLNIAADIFKVLMAGRIRHRLTVHNISIINRISGTILIGFGLALLWGTLFLSDKIK
jgi:threonine/homoserine/homoserine lactone efflux protein